MPLPQFSSLGVQVTHGSKSPFWELENRLRHMAAWKPYTATYQRTSGAALRGDRWIASQSIVPMLETSGGGKPDKCRCDVHITLSLEAPGAKNTRVGDSTVELFTRKAKQFGYHTTHIAGALGAFVHITKPLDTFAELENELIFAKESDLLKKRTRTSKRPPYLRIGKLDALETFWTIRDFMDTQTAFDAVTATYVSQARLDIGTFRVRVNFLFETDIRSPRTEVAPPLILSLNVGPLSCGSLEAERRARRQGVFQRLMREFDALGFHGGWMDGMDSLTGRFTQHIWLSRQAGRALSSFERIRRDFGKRRLSTQ